MKVENYRGTIILLEDGIFKTSDEELKSDTLVGLRKKIDKTTHIRTDVWVRPYTPFEFEKRLFKGVITSIIEDKGYGLSTHHYSAWVSYKNENSTMRLKAGTTLNQIYIINEKNNDLVKKIQELNKQMKELETQKNTLYTQLEPLNIQKFAKDKMEEKDEDKQG